MKNLRAKELFRYIFYTLLIVGALFAIFRLKQLSKQNVQKIVERKQNEIVIPQEKDPLTEILEKGSTAKCDFSQVDANSKINGTIYIAGKELRTDINAPDSSGSLKLSHTIVKNNTTYVWYDKAKNGMKIVMKEAPEVAIETSESGTIDQITKIKNVTGLGDDFVYKCEEWQYDAFVFTPAPEVSFVDGVEFIKQYTQGLCKKCDEEPSDASRLLCRRELRCK